MDCGGFSEGTQTSVCNLLGNDSSGADGGSGLGIGKAVGTRSVVSEAGFAKEDENQQGFLKIVQQQQYHQNHYPATLLGNSTSGFSMNGISGNSSSSSNSPWSVNPLLQHQSFTPFRAPAGMPFATPMPMGTGMPFSLMDGRESAGNLRNGCFTALQWQELEQQALIFKYILAQEPVPAELLMSIKRGLWNTGDFGRHQPSLMAWNPYQIRFGNGKADSEPGRCRRTDGKKWRCSRDAAPDQKYCERHMHRGRPRSRKPVEGQTANDNNSSSSNSGSATCATATVNRCLNSGNGSVPSNGSSSSFGSLAAAAAVARSSVGAGLRTTASISVSNSNSDNNYGTDKLLDVKSFYGAGGGGGQAASDASATAMSAAPIPSSHFKAPLSMLSASKDYSRYMNWMKSDSTEDQQYSGAQMRLPPSTKLNPYTTSNLQLRSPVMANPDFSLLQSTDHEQLSLPLSQNGSSFLPEAQQPLRHFIDNLASSEDQRSSSSSSSATHLSMALPMPMSNASTDLGLGLMMTNNNENPNPHNHLPQNQHASYVPMALGGPLAEALQHSGNSASNASRLGKMTTGALNLLGSESWDLSSPQESPRMASPTGVLQKTLASLSDSSSGSGSTAAKHNLN